MKRTDLGLSSSNLYGIREDAGSRFLFDRGYVVERYHQLKNKQNYAHKTPSLTFVTHPKIFELKQM